MNTNTTKNRTVTVIGYYKDTNEAYYEWVEITNSEGPYEAAQAAAIYQQGMHQDLVIVGVAMGKVDFLTVSTENHSCVSAGKLLKTLKGYRQ